MMAQPLVFNVASAVAKPALVQALLGNSSAAGTGETDIPNALVPEIAAGLASNDDSSGACAVAGERFVGPMATAARRAAAGACSSTVFGPGRPARSQRNIPPTSTTPTMAA